MASETAPITVALVGVILAVDRVTEEWVTVFGLSAREARAVAHLAFAGPMSARALADLLHVTSGAVSFLVRRLSERGWLQVTADTTDRRRTVVAASPRAMELFSGGVQLFERDAAARIREPQPFVRDLAMIEQVLERQRTWCAGLGPLERRRVRALGPHDHVDG